MNLSNRANDNLFKESLKRLGAPRWLRTPMYWFTRAQGFMNDKVNMSGNAFLGFIIFILIVVGMFWGAKVFADTITFSPPTEREDGSQLLPSEIDSYNVYDVGNGSVILSIPGTATSFDLPATSVDQSIALTTKDKDGRESTYSQVVVIPKLTTKPKPPSNIRVQPSGR